MRWRTSEELLVVRINTSLCFSVSVYIAIVLTFTFKMPSCSSNSCQNRSEDHRDLNFYQVPSKNSELREKWIHNIKRAGELPKSTKGFYICSTHFEPHCFKRDLQVNFTQLPSFTYTIYTMYYILYDDYTYKSSCIHHSYTTQNKISTFDSIFCSTTDYF